MVLAVIFGLQGIKFCYVLEGSRMLKDNSYNGMISFADPSRQGLVKIHLFDSAKYICFQDPDMDKDAIGSSVCRQMGFTTASLVVATNDW